MEVGIVKGAVNWSPYSSSIGRFYYGSIGVVSLPIVPMPTRDPFDGVLITVRGRVAPAQRSAAVQRPDAPSRRLVAHGVGARWSEGVLGRPTIY